jgi:hypothetical protein
MAKEGKKVVDELLEELECIKVSKKGAECNQQKESS